MEKKIGINMAAIPERKTGIGFLTINLVKSLIPQLPGNKFILYTQKGKFLFCLYVYENSKKDF